MSTSPITAELKFLANLDGPLVYVPSKGGGDTTDHVGNFVMREVEVHDGRRDLPSSDLDAEGFRLVEQATDVTDFYDDKQISSTYHAEVTELLIQETGARRVEIFDDTRRTSSVDLQELHQIREPANIVHNDYTDRSGAKRLNDLLPDEADELFQRRFAIINVWRSIAGPILDHPLVLCDATTVEPDELIAVERRAEERIGELQVATFGDRQRWYYFPQMQMHEALIFKTFDSATDGRTRFTIHSSCKDPTAPADTPPRESIETRCLVFY
ncbi:MAG: CmcJ/NvfI family oxidoreductase [Woeseiaceae bacterium]